jgi:surface protein
MGHMFEKCKKLEELNISGFNTNKVTNTYEMFTECKSLPQSIENRF